MVTVMLIWAHCTLGMGRGGYMDRFPAILLMQKQYQSPFLGEADSPEATASSCLSDWVLLRHSGGQILLQCLSWAVTISAQMVLFIVISCVCVCGFGINPSPSLLQSNFLHYPEPSSKHPHWPTFVYHCSSWKFQSLVNQLEFFLTLRIL